MSGSKKSKACQRDSNYLHNFFNKILGICKRSQLKSTTKTWFVSKESPLKFRVWGQPRVFVVTNLARAGLATKRLFSPFSKLQNESDHLHYKTELAFRPGISSVTPSPFCHSKIDGHFVRIRLAEFFPSFCSPKVFL